MWFFDKLNGSAPKAQSTDLAQLSQAAMEAESQLLAQLFTEADRVFGGNKVDNEAADKFFSFCQPLSPSGLGAVGYKLATLGCSSGRSGFHGLQADLQVPMPFRFFGWAGCPPFGGIAFRIQRSCFREKSPLLYFQADSTFWDADQALEVIREYSRQIQDVQLVRNEFVNHYPYLRLEFRLMETPPLFDSPLILQGEQKVPMDIVGGPVIQIPICGEFNCEFGHVADGKDIPLHHDDFCMK